MVDLELLQRAVMGSRDSVVIADVLASDMPLVFVNPAFTQLTGYSEHEALGRNCRFLQAGDTSKGHHAAMRSALAGGFNNVVTLRNHRRDGKLFWNELSLSPIHDASGRVTHFIGLQRDVTRRVRIKQRLSNQTQDLKDAKAQLEKMVTVDALTGIYNRRHFDSRLEMLWTIATRTKDPLTLFFIDIDHFKQYNDRFGHQAGDQALIAVAGALGESFPRASDFVARYGGEEFVVVAYAMSAGPAARFAEHLCACVREMAISHPDTPTGQLTISVGYAVTMPQPGISAQSAVAAADDALFAAKNGGRDRASGHGSLRTVQSPAN